MNAGVINFAVYENGSEFLGLAKVALPDSTNKTITVSGAGIPGDVDIPIIGNKEAMKATFEFVDNGMGVYKLCEERKHLIDLRVAHENYDVTKGEIGVTGHKYILEVFPISRSGGDVAPANPNAKSVECSVFSIKEYIDGKLVSEYDPLRYVDVDCTGKNRLGQVAKALGK